MSIKSVPGRIAQAPGELSILPADTGETRSAFLRLPYQLHRSDPNWVPPLRREARKRIGRRNPFFNHAEAGLFIALRGGRTVGRIAAVHDRRPAGVGGVGDGRFGLFECADDRGAAAALAEAAAAWLRKRGVTSMTGPYNFTGNDECGTLIDGFDRPPTVMTAHNPPYYAGLLDACGFAKETDLWSWERACDPLGFPDRVRRLAARVQAADRVHVRPISPADFAAEAERFRCLYNEAMADGHGFRRLRADEFTVLANRLRPWLDPELVQFAEADGRPVGAVLAVPDVNRVLAAAGGRLTPAGILRMRRAARSIDRARLMVLAVSEPYRRRGIDALLLHRLFDAVERSGYRSIEASWVFEGDRPVNRAAAQLGFRRTRVHRIWRREV